MMTREELCECQVEYNEADNFLFRPNRTVAKRDWYDKWGQKMIDEVADLRLKLRNLD